MQLIQHGKMLMNINKRDKQNILIGKHKWINNIGIVLMEQRHGKMVLLKLNQITQNLANYEPDQTKT